MNTVQQQWELYEKNVVPKRVSRIQRKETQRAFYAGAEAVLRIQHGIGDMSDEGGVAVLDGLHEEMRIFVEQVVDGAA